MKYVQTTYKTSTVQSVRCFDNVFSNRRSAYHRHESRRGMLHLIFIFTCLLTIFILSGIFSNAQSSSFPESFKYYTSVMIMPGDTLYEFAQEYADFEHYDSYEEYIREVCRINTMEEEDTLMAGMNLILPYYSTEYK